MFKWIRNLANWLAEHAFVWPWDKDYQSITHLVWVWITFIGMLVIGFTCADVTIGFTILIGGGQIFAVLQELVRWLIAKKTGKGEQKFNVGNIFANIIGIVIGGLLAMLVWLLITA